MVSPAMNCGVDTIYIFPKVKALLEALQTFIARRKGETVKYDEKVLLVFVSIHVEDLQGKQFPPTDQCSVMLIIVVLVWD